MNRKPILILLVFLCAFVFSAHSFAQGTNMDKPPSGGPRKQIGTIIYAGLGGAVLGLSTLSFYGRPQDNLVNIGFGAAIGVMVGTIVVTYNAATNPDDFYGSRSREALLGPATSTTVVASTKNAAPEWSASFEILKF